MRVPAIPDNTLLTVVEFCAILLEKLKLLRGRPRVADQSQIAPPRVVILVQNGRRHINGHEPHLCLPIEILNGGGINKGEL